MANRIEITNINQRNFVDSVSRYLNSDVLYYGDKKLITFETYKRRKFIPSTNDRYYVITKGTEYRPDLVAARAYGNPAMWWRILEVNGIIDIFDFTAGKNIIIPEALLQ